MYLAQRVNFVLIINYKLHTLRPSMVLGPCYYLYSASYAPTTFAWLHQENMFLLNALICTFFPLYTLLHLKVLRTKLSKWI